MASKKNGVVIGIVAVAVIGVVAITFYSQRGRVADEDAAGAIGAAERYRAQQISDEDVILDIPGQEELAVAVFEVLTDEQKAELMGRIGEANRTELFRQNIFDEATFNRMSEAQIAGLARALNRQDLERIVANAKFSADDMALWNDAALAKAFRGLEAAERRNVLDRAGVDEVGFQRMSETQMAGLARSLNRQDMERIAANAKFSADDMALWNDATLAKAFRGLEAAERKGALDRFAVDEDAFNRMSERQIADLARSLNRQEMERIVANAKFSADDMALWNDATLAKAFRGLEAAERKGVLDRFAVNEETFNRMSEAQMAGLARSLNRQDMERIVASAKFSADDMVLWNDAALAKAFRGLEAAERKGVLDRAAFDEEMFQRWGNDRRAAFTKALGAKAFGTAVLQARYFEGLSGAQQRQVWNRLGPVGQEAALRNVGLEAELARGTAMKRDAEFERFMKERRADR